MLKNLQVFSFLEVFFLFQIQIFVSNFIVLIAWNNVYL